MDAVENHLCGCGTWSKINVDILWAEPSRRRCPSCGNVCIQVLSQSGNQYQDLCTSTPHSAINLSIPFVPPFLSLLSLSPAFSCSVLLSLHTVSPLPCPLLCLSSQPILLSLPSPVYGGVVNAMSFLSLSAVRVAIAGDELPVDNFVFAEHSDSQCGVIPPKLATCENSPFGSPLLRWVSNPPGANQSTETGNQVTS